MLWIDSSPLSFPRSTRLHSATSFWKYMWPPLLCLLGGLVDNVMKVAGEAYRMKTGDQTGCGDDVFWLAPLCPLRSKITKLATESHSQFAGLDPHIKSFFLHTDTEASCTRTTLLCSKRQLGDLGSRRRTDISACVCPSDASGRCGCATGNPHWFTD